MKASRVYTAQEMSDVSQRMKESGLDGEIILTVKQSDGSYKEYHGDDIIEMLRQAAEMRERAEELKAQCLKICGRETCDHNGDKCVCCARDVIDFIVRGDNDAGKPDLSVSQMDL